MAPGASRTSPGLPKSFPVIVNISGYISDFAPLNHRTPRKAEGHITQQFIEYEKKDVNPKKRRRSGSRLEQVGAGQRAPVVP
jgi:hypothetical protein